MTCYTHTLFTGKRYTTLKGDLEFIAISKISPYTHSKQTVLHTHTLFTGSRYSTQKGNLEVIPISKITPYAHSIQAVLHTRTLFKGSCYRTHEGGCKCYKLSFLTARLPTQYQGQHTRIGHHQRFVTCPVVLLCPTESVSVKVL